MKDIFKTRRAVRKYTDQRVPEDIIDQIIEAGLWAPSGMGRQSQIILAVSDREIRDTLSRLNAEVMNGTGDPFYGAPQVLVVLADKNVRTYLYDGSVVMENLALKAEELGVASCWIHRAKEVFETEEGKAILKKAGIEGDYEGIGNLIIGYADGPVPEPKERNEGRVFKL